MKAKQPTLEEDKLEIIKWITALQDRTAIARLKMLKENPARKDWWSEITQEEKAAIDKGLMDIRNGKVKPHKEVRKLYEKWL